MNDPSPSKPLPAEPSQPYPPVSLNLPEEQETGGDETQEVDIWWGAYAGRTMWPSFVVCALLTLAIGVAAFGWWQLNPKHPHLVRYTGYWLAGMIWSAQLLRWGYRTLSINYRLTSRRLFRDRGFHNPAAGRVDLSNVAAVEVERGGYFERLARRPGACAVQPRNASPGSGRGLRSGKGRCHHLESCSTCPGTENTEAISSEMRAQPENQRRIFRI